MGMERPPESCEHCKGGRIHVFFEGRFKDFTVLERPKTVTCPWCWQRRQAAHAAYLNSPEDPRD